tara:strand:- start:3971 stop:4366 length:396 start_codon:yes stop_codon:yes gene_type:complete
LPATFKRAAPYKDDVLNLPVASVADAVSYYETVMGFRVVSRGEAPHASAVLARDDIQIGLAENGGDPTQEGAFFEVDDVEAAFEELQSNGLGKDDPEYRVDQHGEKSYRVFFIIAPDELCYCVGEDVTGKA